MTDAEINGCRNSLDNADCGRCPLRARCIKLGLVELLHPFYTEPPEDDDHSSFPPQDEHDAD